MAVVVATPWRTVEAAREIEVLVARDLLPHNVVHTAAFRRAGR